MCTRPRSLTSAVPTLVRIQPIPYPTILLYVGTGFPSIIICEVVTASNTLLGITVLFVVGSWPSFSSTESHLTISSALVIIPPAPALRLAILSSNQNGIRRPKGVQVCVSSPESFAAVGENVVVFIPIGLKRR